MQHSIANRGRSCILLELHGALMIQWQHRKHIMHAQSLWILSISEYCGSSVSGFQFTPDRRMCGKGSKRAQGLGSEFSDCHKGRPIRLWFQLFNIGILNCVISKPDHKQYIIKKIRLGRITFRLYALCCVQYLELYKNISDMFSVYNKSFPVINRYQ